MFHVDIPTTRDIASLFGLRSEACVSIYLKTTPVTHEIEASKIEFSNLIRQAISELETQGLDKRTVWEIQDVLDEVQQDDILWRYQAHTLAVFATPDSVRTFRLANLIDSRVEVSDRFNIKPLLRSTTFDQSAYVIAVSENGMRLIEIFADLPPEEIKDPNFPEHLYSEVTRRSRKDVKAGDEDLKRAITKYSRLIDAAIAPLLKHSDIPVIVMAAQPIASIFHNLCTAKNLLPQIISCSPDRIPLHEIAAAAREVLQGHYASKIEELHELYEARFQKRRATDKLEEVARAATIGSVETLYIDIDSEAIGTIDESTGAVNYHPAEGTIQYNLVGEITRRAFSSGAHVIALRRADIPRGVEVAATLRFPI